MKKHVLIPVRGKTSDWVVNCFLSDASIKAMTADGVDIGIVYYSIPTWVAQCGLARPWCFIQDVFNFRNPFWSKDK